MKPQPFSQPPPTTGSVESSRVRNREAPRRHFSFSGHETFAFRYSWIKKSVDAVTANSKVFNDDAAVVILGVGKNMVRAIRHWGLATGVLMDKHDSGGLVVSELGKSLFGLGGKDP